MSGGIKMAGIKKTQKLKNKQKKNKKQNSGSKNISNRDLLMMAYQSEFAEYTEETIDISIILEKMLENPNYDKEDLRAFAMALCLNLDAPSMLLKQLKKLMKSSLPSSPLPKREVQKNLDELIAALRKRENNAGEIALCDEVYYKTNDYVLGKLTDEQFNTFMESLVFFSILVRCDWTIAASALNLLPLFKKAIADKNWERIRVLEGIGKPVRIVSSSNIQFYRTIARENYWPSI